MKKIISKILISLILFVTVFSNSSFNITPAQASPALYKDQWISLHPELNGKTQLGSFYSTMADKMFSTALSDDAITNNYYDEAKIQEFVSDLNIYNYWTLPAFLTTSDQNVHSDKWDFIMYYWGAGFQSETNYLMQFEIQLLSSDARKHFIEPIATSTAWQNISAAGQDLIRAILFDPSATGTAFTQYDESLVAYANLGVGDKHKFTDQGEKGNEVLNWMYSSSGPLSSFTDNRFKPEFTDAEINVIWTKSRLGLGIFFATLHAIPPSATGKITEAEINTAKADTAVVMKAEQTAVVAGDIAAVRTTSEKASVSPFLESSGGVDGMTSLVVKKSGISAESAPKMFGEEAIAEINSLEKEVGGVWTIKPLPISNREGQLLISDIDNTLNKFTQWLDERINISSGTTGRGVVGSEEFNQDLLRRTKVVFPLNGKTVYTSGSNHSFSDVSMKLPSGGKIEMLVINGKAVTANEFSSLVHEFFEYMINLKKSRSLTPLSDVGYSYSLTEEYIINYFANQFIKKISPNISIPNIAKYHIKIGAAYIERVKYIHDIPTLESAENQVLRTLLDPDYYPSYYTELFPNSTYPFRVSEEFMFLAQKGLLNNMLYTNVECALISRNFALAEKLLLTGDPTLIYPYCH